MSDQLKGLHDKLLAEKPDGAAHDEASCPLCALKSSDINEGVSVDDQPEGGSMSADKTYTEDELKAEIDKAVTDATSELQAKLAELEGSVQQSEIDSAVAAAKAEVEETIKELQAKLDAAVLEAETEKKAREELEANIDAEKKAAEEAAALDARKDAVREQVKDLGFSDDHIKANLDRWAKQSEDEFAKSVEDWRVIAAKEGSGGAIPSTSAMTASRQEANSNQGGSALSSLGEVRRELAGSKL